MRLAAYLLLFAWGLQIGPLAGDDELVFHSDVSLVRVDAQVVDSGNRAITHLHAGDFILREDGRVVPIRNFASENMPVDVLFVLDVSASMRPHVQRIADASAQALTVLGKDDRMGIMVFDRDTRVRLAFSNSRKRCSANSTACFARSALMVEPISPAPCSTPRITFAARVAATPAAPLSS